MVLVERRSEKTREMLVEHVGASRDKKAIGKNPILLIPAHWAEAHGAEVCAKHLDTQPETMPVLSGSPTRRRGTW